MEGHENDPQTASSFDLAYQYLMQSHDEGTYYEITTNDLTFKVKYSNMYTLINEFATKVYLQYGIDTKQDKNKRYSQFICLGYTTMIFLAGLGHIKNYSKATIRHSTLTFGSTKMALLLT